MLPGVLIKRTYITVTGRVNFNAETVLIERRSLGLWSSDRRDVGERWAEIAYEAIAPVYDDFTAHHNYELWLGNLLPELEPHGLRGGRLLDVGCGTGKSFIPMLERGWKVTACDISAAMVELARAKVGEAVELSVADMRVLPVLRRVRPRLGLDDAVNYLLDTDEL